MMDSNSGSVQSSSGGEDYDDSRAAESIPSFLNPPPSHHHQLGQGMFDSLSNYFDPPPPPPAVRNSNQLLLNNLDMVWPSRNPRSDQNPSDLSYIMSSSQPSPNSNTQFFPTTTSHQLLPTPSENNPASRQSGPALSASNDQATLANTSAVRPSKKRSRASRRAPTTVLTTDTTNFRAMVQEFTGIPAPPFTSSHFPRTRLDLFNVASSIGGSGGTSITTPPAPAPYILRPFAQKFQTPPNPFSSPTSTTSTIINASAMVDNTPRNIIPSSSNKEFLNMNDKNPLLTFPSSLYQPPSKYSSLSSLSNLIGSNTQRTSREIPQNDQYGLGQVNNKQQLLNGGDHLDGNYGNSLQQITNGKINYSASSSDVRGDKGPPGNASVRSEGMVESWIN